MAALTTASPRRVIALCGPPNVGKSTLFNQLTGLRQKVANYPGITVEKKIGILRLTSGEELDLVDLPGACSLDPQSEDERIAVEVLRGENEAVDKPAAAILMLDSTNLARHLSHAPGILDLGIPTLVVLNMTDELASRGGAVDAQAVAAELGVPVAAISARNGAGVDGVLRFIEGSSAPVKRVELPVIQNVPAARRWAGGVVQRSGYEAPGPPEWSRRLDRIFLHPVAGPLIFLSVVLAVFQSIFTLAVPLMDAVDASIGATGIWLGAMLPDVFIKGLLIDGVWGGVGSVVIFLPQILILFLFIGVLEDSGYLARAAVIADRTMRVFGLQGKSFIPLPLRLRLCRTRNHGGAYNRKQARSHGHATRRAPNDLLGAVAGLRPADRGIHTRAADTRSPFGNARRRTAGALRGRLFGRGDDRLAAEVHDFTQYVDTIHVGVASVPNANSALAFLSPSRSLKNFLAACRHSDTGDDDHFVGACEFPARQRRAAEDRG